MDLRNRISRTVRQSWLAANTAFDRVTVSEQLMAQATLALDLAQTRYKLGLSSIVELSQAQLQQTQAEIGSAEQDMDIVWLYPCCDIKPSASETGRMKTGIKLWLFALAPLAVCASLASKVPKPLFCCHWP